VSTEYGNFLPFYLKRVPLPHLKSKSFRYNQEVSGDFRILFNFLRRKAFESASTDA
jgi:hypothetical protein